MKIKTAWVVRINLNDYANDKEPNCLGEIKDSWQNDEILDYLAEMVIPVRSSEDVLSRFQNKLFRTALDKRMKFQIVIFFDGFDEISPSYKEKTFLLLEALKDTNIAQLWITTRVHEKVDLENRLKTASHILYPFSDDDQETFLRKYLVWKLTFQDEAFSEDSLVWVHEHLRKSIKNIVELAKSTDDVSLERLRSALSSIGDVLESTTLESIEDFFEDIAKGQGNYVKPDLDFSGYVKILLKNWKVTINDTHQMFTFTPLHLKMLAEIVFENQLQLPANLEMLSFYQKFAQIKFDIFHREKTATTVGNVGAETKDSFFSESLRKIHHELAVKLFFPEKYSQKSLPRLNAFDTFKEWLKKYSGRKREAEQELARVGLVCLRNGELSFVHRSFAEYFLSDYLIENLRIEEVQKILFKQVFYESDFILVRQFIDDQINKYYKYKYKKLDLDRLLKKQHISRDAYEKKMSDVPGEYLENLSQICFHEDFFNNKFAIKSAVYTVLVGNHDGIIRFICEKCKGREEILRTILLTSDDDHEKETLLHIAVYMESYEECFVSLWENLVEYPTFLKEIIVKKNKSGETVLLLAAQQNHHEILKKMLDTFTSDENIIENFMSPIEKQLIRIIGNSSSSRHHKNIQVILEALKKVPDVLKEFLFFSLETGQNYLQWAVSNNNFEISQVILGAVNNDLKKRLMFTTDPLGKTPLFLACESKNRETTQVLIENVDNEEMLEDLLLISSYLNNGKLEESIVTLINSVAGENSKVYLYLRSILEKISDITRKSSALHSAIKEKDFVEVRDIYCKNETFHKHLILAKDDSGQNSLELAVENEAVELVEYFLQNFCKYDNMFRTILSYTDQTCKVLLHKIALSGKTSIAEAYLTHVNNDVLKETILCFDETKSTPLDLAIFYGHHELFQLFLKKIDEKIPQILTKLILGCSSMCDRMCCSVSDITSKSTWDRLYIYDNICNRHGLPPLHWAVINNRVDVVKDLVNFVKNNNGEIYRRMLLKTSLKGKTILHHIFANGHRETLETLLHVVEFDVIKNMIFTVDENGNNALFPVAYFYKTEILSVFLNWAKDNANNTFPNSLKTFFETVSDTKQNILHFAVRNALDGTLEFLVEFIKNSVGIETFDNLILQQDVNGKTPFMGAIESAHYNTFDIIVKNISQQTLVQSLLKSDDSGDAPLHLLIRYNYYNGIIKSLFEWSKSNINNECVKQAFLRTNNKRRTILILTVCCRHLEALQLLFDVLKDDQEVLNEVLLKTDLKGYSALHWAAFYGYKDVTEVFLDLTKKYCTKAVFRKVILIGDNRGRSFLAIAASEGQLETIRAAFEILKEDHFDVMADLLTSVDNCKRTVMHWAYWNNRTEIVQFLLKTAVDFSELHDIFSSLKRKLDKIKAEKDSLEVAILNRGTNTIDVILEEMNPDNKKELTLALFKYGKSFLEFASIKGYRDNFERLIQHIDDSIYTDVILELNEYGETAIDKAILARDSHIFRALLEKTKKHQKIFKKLLLGVYDRGLLLKDVIKNKAAKLYTDHDHLLEVLRNFYYEMAASLMENGEVDYEFNIEELKLLAEHFKEDYNGSVMLSKVLEHIKNRIGN